MFGGTAVNGDNQKFREFDWRREGLGRRAWTTLRCSSKPGRTPPFCSTAHALKDDYKIRLSLRSQRPRLHSFRLGPVSKILQRHRRFSPPASTPAGAEPESGSVPGHRQSLGRILASHCRIGRGWSSATNTITEQGDEATTSWGAAGAGINDRNIAPASKSIKEGTHVIKFDLDAEVKGVTIEDRFRGEFYSLNTHYTNLASRGAGVRKT